MEKSLQDGRRAVPTTRVNTAAIATRPAGSHYAYTTHEQGKRSHDHITCAVTVVDSIYETSCNRSNTPTLISI